MASQLALTHLQHSVEGVLVSGIALTCSMSLQTWGYSRGLGGLTLSWGSRTLEQPQN